MHGSTFFQKKKKKHKYMFFRSGLSFRIGENMPNMMGAIDIDGNERLS